MRILIPFTILGLSCLTAVAQLQVPDALLPAQTNAVPDALVPQATNLLSHTLQAKEASAAWDELSDASRPPKKPAAWELNEPGEKEQADFFRPYVLALMDKAKDFYTRFPKDTNTLDARKQEFEMTGLAMQLGASNLQPRMDAEEKVLLTDTNLTEDERFGIRRNDIERGAQMKESENETAALDEFEKGIRALQKEFPKRPEVMDMLLDVATEAEGARARTMLQEIINSPVASDQVKDSASSQLKKLEAVGKPVTLQFTAVDGREVDLAKMKGKVVLIDFWATWCAPCVAEIPHVIDAYEQQHAKGFEVVGVSLDKEKEALTEFVSSHKMAWPQYFDGLEWQNKFAQQFGIESIPAMWLVDKQGNLRDINARSGLSGKIAKLLAE